MTDKQRADVEKVREVAEHLGSPGQAATPDERETDDRDLLQDEIRRRQASGADTPVGDRDPS